MLQRPPTPLSTLYLHHAHISLNTQALWTRILEQCKRVKVPVQIEEVKVHQTRANAVSSSWIITWIIVQVLINACYFGVRCIRRVCCVNSRCNWSCILLVAQVFRLRSVSLLMYPSLPTFLYSQTSALHILHVPPRGDRISNFKERNKIYFFQHQNRVPYYSFLLTNYYNED